ncbi:MAG: FAD/NAD(P)-binding oxidoreductase [Thermodesulfovibrionia bacterium]
MASHGKTILILGGGVGGLESAIGLRKRLGKEHRIIVIDKNSEYISSSSLLWVMIGWRRTEEIKKDLSHLRNEGIEFINGEVIRIDPANKSVKTREEELGYDYLIISLGADLYPDIIPGLTDALKGNAYNIYTLDGIMKARDAIEGFKRGNVIVLICSLPYKCPAAPYETTFLLNYFFKKKGLRNDVNIKIYTPEVMPMPVAGPEVGKMMKEMLERMGIGYNFEHKVEQIDGEKKEITFDKGKTGYDLLLVIPPHKAPRVIKESGLTDNDWIPVDRETLKTRFENTYAIGDVTKIKIPGEWKSGIPLMLPKAGVFAHYEARVVAENIANEILGKGENAKYTGEGACFIETGHGMAGFGKGNFYATPHPLVKMYRPSPFWHWGKVLFEKYWLSESMFKGTIDTILEKTMYGEYKKTKGVP